MAETGYPLIITDLFQGQGLGSELLRRMTAVARAEGIESIVLDLSKEILRSIPTEARDISALTLCVSREKLPELKRMVQEVRRESIGRVGVLRQQAKQNHRNVHGGLRSLATRTR